MSFDISIDVRFPSNKTILPKTEHNEESLLICYVSITVQGIVMHGITVSQEVESKEVKVSYPYKKQLDGSKLNVFYPKDSENRKTYEEKIIKKVLQVMKKREKNNPFRNNEKK